MRTIFIPYTLNKGLISKFPEDYLDQEKPEDGSSAKKTDETMMKCSLTVNNVIISLFRNLDRTDIINLKR